MQELTLQRTPRMALNGACKALIFRNFSFSHLTYVFADRAAPPCLQQAGSHPTPDPCGSSEGSAAGTAFLGAVEMGVFGPAGAEGRW